MQNPFGVCVAVLVKIWVNLFYVNWFQQTQILRYGCSKLLRAHPRLRLGRWLPKLDMGRSICKVILRSASETGR